MASASSPSPDAPRRDWFDAGVLTASLWTIVVVLYLPMLIARHPGEGWDSAGLEGATVLLAMAQGMLLFAVHRMIAPIAAGWRFLILAATIAAIAAFQTLCDFAFTYWIALTIKPHWSREVPAFHQSYNPFFTYVCLFTFNLALFQLVFLRRRATAHALQLAAARLATQRAELAALRFQLNPHFLFNSLNAISAMIVTRRYDDAETMTDRLSTFLRNSLASDPTAMVDLDTELAMIEEYLEIETVRFGDRLRIEIDRDTLPAETPVPSHILQPLVENAVKYGVARSIKPVTIRIAGRAVDGRAIISVENGLPSATEPVPPGTGVGLRNVRERLAALYGTEADMQIETNPDSFTVRLTLPASS